MSTSLRLGVAAIDLLLTLAAYSGVPVEAQTRIKITRMDSLPASRDPFGVWSGNSFVTIENARSSAPIIRVYGESGNVIQSATVQIPGAKLIMTTNNKFARSADGYLAVSCSAYTDDRSASFVVVVSPDGTQTVIRTNPFKVQAMTFASDGSIWAAGQESVDGYEVEGDYDLIRHFDRSGRILGGAVRRARFPQRYNPSMGSWLVASKDRVGWFSRAGGQYIEFSLDGKELGSFRHEMEGSQPGAAWRPSSVAICDDNGVWALAERREEVPRNVTWTLNFLDRSRGIWTARERQASIMYLYGCNGTSLAALAANARNAKEIVWITAQF